jgi:putative membrane protein
MTEQEIRRVAEVVAEVERKTVGEIVPVVVKKSDDYPDASWRIAVTIALLAAFGLYAIRPNLEPIYYLWIQLPALFAGFLLGSVPGFQRLFLNREKMAEEVEQRAVEGFHALQLHASKGRTGIMILVSKLERQAVILADVGISANVSPGTWDGVVARLIDRIKAGQLTEGLCVAVEECGRILAEKFPATEDDVNELPNQPVIED